MAPHGRTPPPGSLDSSPPDSALFARLKRLAEARPDAAALRSDDKVVARATLVAEAEAVAAALVAAGVRPGGRVGVCAGRSAEAIVAMAGIVAAGAAYVPLDPAHASGQVGLMARDAGLSVCLVADAEAEWAENALPTTCARLDLAACRRGAPGPVLPAEPGGEAPACLLYTSGTTGDPKGVVIPRRAIAGLAAQSWTRLSEADRVLHVTTPAADGSLFEIWAALLAGASVAVLPPGLPTAGAVADAMRKHRVTAILWYAALHHLVIDHDIDAFETVRLNVAGGERMSSGHAARLLSRWPGIELWNSYGPTEATTGALRQRVTPEIAAAGEIPIGTPYDGFAAFLVDGSGAPLPDEPGQEGEIALSGPGVALCYHDRPRETAAAFVFDPRRGQTGTVYLTGDRGRRRADGGLDFLGRTDRQVKIGGRRVELDGVEAALAVHPDVAAAACWPVTAPGGATHLAAAIRPAAGARRAGLAERARAAAARLVGAAVLPRRLSVVEAMPLTPAGKIDRRALAEALAGPGRAEAAEGVRATLAAVWDDLLGCGTPHDEASFFELGGNSLVLIEAHLRIEAALGVRVPMSDLLSAPRFSAQVDRLEALLARPVRGERRAAAPRPAGPEGSRDIAIIGMAARLPGLKAEGPAALDHFWEALRAGRSLIRRSVPDDGGAEGDGEGGGEGGRGPRARIEGAELFDCAHFDILPREADLMDPQARIFLELCRHALDDAGIAGERGPTAVFAGAAPSRYLEAIADGRADGPERGDEAARLGNAMDAVATRVAHRLGLTGPAMSVGAACSASLVAVAQAVACLRAGQADVALAGGAFLSFPRDGASDPDGEAERTCRPFDAEAAGTVSGDGAGVVALRRLDDALRDGDPIRAVIRGAGLNNDGADRASFSAPSVAGQAGAIRMALADAGIAPGSIGHVEAHGMATPLGDAVEVAALAQAFEGTSGEEAPVVLGTVKGTIGHADVASGVLGLIKTVLVLERGEIPPIAGLRTPSPDLPLAGTPIRLALAPVRWEEGARPRRAGVSSFGVGGTNAHLVLEEAPPDERAVPEGPQILPLSARSPEALAEAAHALAERLDRRDAPPLARVAATLQHGRAEEPFRLAVAARAAGQAADRLRAAPRPDAPVSGTPPEIVFVFPGPAAAYPGMGAGLYRAEPVYRATIDAGAEALAALTGTDIRRVLFARDMAQSEAAEALRRADIAGPALYLTEVALGRLWEARGVGPAAVVGCSVGGI